MTVPRTRRSLLADVGRMALFLSLGEQAAAVLGERLACAKEEPGPLGFGGLEALVALMQETPAERVLPALVERLRGGTELRTLLAAGALANARTFGGEDYVGFHTLMALAPAWHMALALPEPRRALPVLKVLYRNTSRMQEVGGRTAEVLHPVRGTTLPEGRDADDVLRDAVRAKDVETAERTFAVLARGSAEEALGHVLPTVQDGAEVHRVVLPMRAWELVGLIGAEHAHTLLRQSVRYCVKSEKSSPGARSSGIREILPRLLEAHHLLGRAPGARAADDAWIEAMSRTLFESTPEQAAATAASALAEGFAPADLGEATSLAANQLLLRDAGRTEREVRPGKPLGSVHGDSIGLHACDSSAAWRNLARVGTPRNIFACAIAGAYQVALDRTARGGDFLHWSPRPEPEDLARVAGEDPDALLREADAAIQAQDQARASAVVQRYGLLGLAPQRLLDLLLRYAVSEDGALQAEKYFRTATEEFAAARPAFRWRHLVALARVTASEFGQRAAGHDEACRLLGVER